MEEQEWVLWGIPLTYKQNTAACLGWAMTGEAPRPETGQTPPQSGTTTPD